MSLSLTRIFHTLRDESCAKAALEAGVGIEPTNGAFAEPSLTTWLPRHTKE